MGDREKGLCPNHFRKLLVNYKITESRLSLLHPDSLLQLLKENIPLRGRLFLFFPACAGTQCSSRNIKDNCKFNLPSWPINPHIGGDNYGLKSAITDDAFADRE